MSTASGIEFVKTFTGSLYFGFGYFEYPRDDCAALRDNRGGAISATRRELLAYPRARQTNRVRVLT